MSKKMQSELVAILSDLIALPSPYPPGTSVEICAYTAKRLKKAGYKVEVITKAKGVDNVVARMKGKGRGPVIAFNAHVDTVGVGERANWKSDPYKALVKGGLVYGLGAQRPFDQGVNEAKLAAFGLLGKEAPPYVALNALPVTKDNILEAWETVYHAPPPDELVAAAGG